MTDAFQRALALHRQGQWRQAELAYREVLAQNPRHSDSLHMLGVLAHQSGRPDQAVGYLQNALIVAPGQAPIHHSLGEALRALGNLDEARASFAEAARCDDSFVPARFSLGQVEQALGHADDALANYRRTIWLKPDHAEAYNQLGTLFHAQQDYDAADRHFRKALELNPNLVDALNNLANLLQQRGELNEAIATFDRALRLLPDAAALYYNLANAQRAAGQFQRALASYRRAIELAPAFARAHNNLGTLLDELDDPRGAQSSLAQAVQVEPRFVEAQFNLAALLHKQKDLDSARAGYLRVVEIDPTYATAWFNVGTIDQAARKWDQAKHYYEEALRARPGYAAAHCNLGTMCQAWGHDDEALAHFNRALEIDPACAEAHCDRAMLRLGQGHFDAGWDELRWHVKSTAFCRRTFNRPPWEGGQLADRTLLIHCQQGLGDTIQFSRYVQWVRRQGVGHILLAAQTVLHPLLESSGLGTPVSLESPPRDFDLQVSLLNLPRLCHAAHERVPDQIPYLRTRPELIDQWRGPLSAIDGFKVGINWQGNPCYDWDHLRSVPLAEFEALAQVPGVKLISLQQGFGTEQLGETRRRFEILDLGPEVDRDHGAFMDTAAIMKHLDLVITSDTAIAHLAGALGVPVWLALSAAPEWRWQRAGEKCVWYPTMRLLRQSAWGDWTELFRRIAQRLREAVSAHASPSTVTTA